MRETCDDVREMLCVFVLVCMLHIQTQTATADCSCCICTEITCKSNQIKTDIVDSVDVGAIVEKETSHFNMTIQTGHMQCCSTRLQAHKHKQ